MASESSSSGPPLGKYLASTGQDKKTRDKAIKNLAAFISDSSRDALPQAEMAKLWKGIFYCFWMSDKPLVQQALATEIADILLEISSVTVSLAFLRGFWESTVREWTSIDRHRIDKYYMLVRRFVNASFRLLVRAKWDTEACREYNSILTNRGGPLCPDDQRVPTSLAYHLSDIYIEELDKALGNSPIDSPLPAPLCSLLAPFITLSARTPTAITYKRIQSALVDPLLTALTPHHDSDSDSDEPPSRKRPRLSTPTFPNLIANACATDPSSEGALLSATLRKLLLKQIFDVAREPDTRDANRRKMYALWKEQTDGSGQEGDVDGS